MAKDLFGNEIVPPLSGVELIESAPVDEVYALISGGNDSMAMLGIAMESSKFRGAIHINTGVGVEATREYVRDTCRAIGCPLLEYCAKDNTRADGTPDPQIYEELVMEQGFPGPTKFGHGKMYNRLKERALWRFKREHGYGSKNKVGLVTGVRSQESVRRMGTVEPMQIEGGHVWIAAIHDVDGEERHKLRERYGFPQNPVARELCKSGECYCGGFGTEGELEELTIHDFSRDFGYWMLDLQKRVYAEMVRKFGKGWLWHERKPKQFDSPGQQLLPGVMCTGCESHREEENSG